MRHRMRGRKLGRNTSHRAALFRSMCCALIRTARPDEDDPQRPKVAGRIVTTLAKAKELRPKVERLITIARRAKVQEGRAEEFATNAERNSDEWKRWRESDRWQQWARLRAPAVTARRRAFAALRDKVAVEILFSDLAARFADRQGGYTRVARLPEVRLGDAGQKAILEFVGDERDRVRTRRRTAPVVAESGGETQAAGAGAGEGAQQG